MNCKDAKRRVLAAINDGTYDPAEGCRWPRDVLAAYTELSEKTVTRATLALEADGHLRVHRPGRRGECNTYFVTAWSPPLRKRTIARLDATRPTVLRLRESKCPPNRTAGRSRAQTTVATPPARALSPRCSSLKDQRGWSREATKHHALSNRCGRESARTGLRRPNCMEHAKRRHLHVADLTCLHCADKDAELERKNQIIRTLQVELNKAMEDLAAQTAATRAAGRAAIAAKGQRTRQARADATLEQIEAVVAHWRYHRPRTTGSFGQPGSKSYDVIEKAVKLMTPEPTAEGRLEGVRACCEAISGLHMAPWWAYGKRYSKPGPGRQLKRDVQHALGDEQTIERCRGILRWARGDGADRAFEMWRAACVVEQAWWRTVLDELAVRRERAQGFEVEVDGVLTREDGS